MPTRFFGFSVPLFASILLISLSSWAVGGEKTLSASRVALDSISDFLLSGGNVLNKNKIPTRDIYEWGALAQAHGRAHRALNGKGLSSQEAFNTIDELFIRTLILRSRIQDLIEEKVAGNSSSLSHYLESKFRNVQIDMQNLEGALNQEKQLEMLTLNEEVSGIGNGLKLGISPRNCARN